MDPIETCSRGDLQLGRGLAFCARDKKQLYLGFVFEQAFGIEPCREGTETWWARNNIKNGEGRQVLELLEAISLYKWQGEWCVDKMQAKFHSPIAGQSGHFFGVTGGDVLTEYRPLWGNDLPADLWP